MNVYLIGMMGSGKTAVGEALAVLTGLDFVDLDSRIEKRENRSISEIFASSGEAFFRRLETQAVRDASSGDHQIISTGGGVLTVSENLERMKAGGQAVYLETSLPELMRRLEGSQDRPLLKTADWKKTLKQLLETREPGYRQTASFTVITDGKTPVQIAGEIAVLLGIQR